MYLPGRDFKLYLYSERKAGTHFTSKLSLLFLLKEYVSFDNLPTFYPKLQIQYIITVRMQTVMGEGKDTVCYHDILRGDINPGTININILLNNLK